MMLFALQEHVQEHAAEAAHGAAEKYDAGKTIIEHVSNSGIAHPLIHLPKIAGIDFSVTKHVLMLWLVSGFIFVVLSWTVRRYRRQERPLPSGFANAVEFLVEWIRDAIVLPKAICEPDCSPGFTCLHGACVTACNPGCASGEQCGGDRTCHASK